jgi:hypothetical protein
MKEAEEEKRKEGKKERRKRDMGKKRIQEAASNTAVPSSSGRRRDVGTVLFLHCSSRTFFFVVIVRPFKKEMRMEKKLALFEAIAYADFVSSFKRKRIPSHLQKKFFSTFYAVSFRLLESKAPFVSKKKTVRSFFFLAFVAFMGKKFFFEGPKTRLGDRHRHKEKVKRAAHVCAHSFYSWHAPRMCGVCNRQAEKKNFTCVYIHACVCRATQRCSRSKKKDDSGKKKEFSCDVFFFSFRSEESTI